MSGDEKIQKGFRVRGKVQGVFFRAWTRDTASSLGLGGMVRNLPDGSVEAHLVGSAGSVGEMAARFWEGPPAARVEEVEEMESNVMLDGDRFEILY